MERYAGTKLEQDVIITGEAVALQVRPASVGLRTLSALIDYGYLLCGLGLSMGLFFSLFTVNSDSVIASVIGLGWATWTMIIPITVETLTRGSSLGKYAVGLRVVRDDGGPISLRHAFVRALLSLAEIWVTSGLLALITALINRRGKRLGDFLAGTYVISQAIRPPRPVLVMPPDLAQWAAVAQVRALPDPLSVSVRAFLSQSRQMIPATRHQVASSLAGQVEKYVSPPPPWGVDPERFLASALVVRRDFEYDLTIARAERRYDKVARLVRSPYELEGASS